MHNVAKRGIGSYSRGNMKPGWKFTIEGAKGIKALLGRVMDITGRVNEVFTPGQGLTNAGIELLGAQLANMTIGDISALLDMQNLDPVVVFNLMKDMWKLFEAIYNDLIDTFTSGKMLEYLLGDLHLRATYQFPKLHLTFFHVDYFFLVGGIVPMNFAFGVQGYVGLEIEIGAKVLKLFAYAIATPSTGIKLYGEAGIGFILYAKLRLTGAICEVRFPTMMDTYFLKFPLSVRVRMDIVLIPLILKLKALVTLEVNLWFISFRVVLFRALIWKYQAPSIRGNIFDTHGNENDDSGPIFEAHATKEPDIEFNFDDVEKRERRSVQSRTNQCQVHQIAGRDYTEPAFEISVKATDDKSRVNLYLDVGIVPGGNEILKSKKLAGESTVMTNVLWKAAGRSTYFRVRGQNSQGSNAYVDCSIPTYDLTPPVARVKTNAFITSNRHVIEGFYRAFDDSAISREMFAFGFGKSSLDDQISPWKVFTSVVPVRYGPSGNNEHFFTAPAEGRLLVSITKTIYQVLNPNECGGYCLKEVPHKCMSFNYHYGKTGACELLEGIESIDNKLTKSDMFYYYERLGSGSAVSLSRKDLMLTHNNLHYINVEIINSLGYRSLKSSSGILTDFTLPEPGPIANQSKDVLEFRPCGDLIPPDKDEWRGLCVGVDSREKNSRVIIDGEGSKTMFNGGIPLRDLRFTRSNRYIAGNWDGFHDTESGIRGYTLAVGETICEERIREHRDPHDHLNHESEWTHKETIEVDPQLKDGSYYLTIRALNRADYGGPLAVTVCHTTPYVIDNTAPILKNIRNIAYNDVTSLLTANHNASDSQSHIMAIYACLGRTKRTCDIKEWFLLPVEKNFIRIPYQLPDGVQTWVKLKAYNHVDMFTEVVADSPIMVDRSPPLAGSVFDGETVHVDQRYFKYQRKICASWLGFSDPQSGLTSFELSVGTARFSVDIVNRHRIGSHHSSFCIDLGPYNRTLTHNRMYFFTVTAWNGGIVKMSVNASSTGVIIDLTPPVKGEVVDGSLQGFRDVNISSISSIVAGQFRGFNDPESGINDTEIQVDVAPSLTGEFDTVHAYQSIYQEHDFQWAHFHLKHKDRVRTLLRATNGANNAITGTTDGFLVDLTPPKLDFIRVVDERNPEKDFKYQTVDNKMSVSYGFHDEESGIYRYRVRLYESYENRKTLLDESAYIQANQTLYNHKDLKIKNGAYIYTEVESQNMAVPGLNVMARSSDVKVDTTPPVMSYVLVGVNSGEIEEKHNDTVFQSVTEGILASWKGSDGQSGIDDYQVCVGTSADKCDELSWKSMGASEDGYINGLSLGLTSTTGEYYYVRVRAKNSAGLMSEPITGTRIAVLNEDATGHIADGPAGTDSINQEMIGEDIDVTLDGHIVTMQFDGFSSHLYGIQHVEWAIGSSQYGEDVQPFMSKGTILSEDDTSLFGHAGSGTASAPVDLEPGKMYFASVRVTTYQGNVLEASSDGFIIDQTPPSIIITRMGLHDKQTADLTEGNAIYQQTDAMLSASWQYTEDFQVSLG
ncbi:uncharacterized protein LOC135497734 [Lineus longissimus]|uniref:uncharacterized protein LOC135497734 n=1 Tax=Lineus longissimus TaxID=88925 RepID=UPI00315C9FB8